MTRVSVVLPVRNGERYLRDAVESVLAQTLRDLELIVVDDGSIDATPEVLRSFGDPRLRVIAQDALGLVAALNRGLAEASAPYVARQDADDRSLPQRLERQVAFLDANPRVALVSTWVARVDGEGVQRDVLAVPGGSEALQRAMLVGNPFAHGSVMVRADAVAEAGGYRSDYPHNEDYDLWRRVAMRHEVASIPEVLYIYREHAGAVSQAHAAEQAAHRVRLLDELWRDAELPSALDVVRGGRATRDARERSAYVDLQLGLARELVRRKRLVRAAAVALGALALDPRRLRYARP